MEGYGLLFKRFDRADGVGTLRDNVAVLFARVGRLNAHQGEVRVPLPGQLGQRFQRGEIVIVDIGVYRADDDLPERKVRLHYPAECRRRQPGQNV